MSKFLSLLTAVALTALSSCATVPNQAKLAPSDTLINYNRATWAMNLTLDKHIVHPISIIYLNHVPSGVRSGIKNFFNNLDDAVSLGNYVLQLKLLPALRSLLRLSINTVLGGFGINDVASQLGMVQEQTTFGQTLKQYGWKTSRFFMLPILGPSTIRDSLGVAVDFFANPEFYLFSTKTSYLLFAVNAVDTRSSYLMYDQLLNLTLDPYLAVRNTYLQSIGQPIPNSENSTVNQGGVDALFQP